MIPPRRSKAHTRAHPNCPRPSWWSSRARDTPACTSRARAPSVSNGTTCSPASCPPRVPVAAETVRHLSKRVDGGSAQRRVGVVRQARHHEPPPVECLGVAWYRLRPGLPGPAPGEVAIGGGPPNSERKGQLAHRLTGGGEPAQLLLPIPAEVQRLGGRVPNGTCRAGTRPRDAAHVPFGVDYALFDAGCARARARFRCVARGQRSPDG